MINCFGRIPRHAFWGWLATSCSFPAEKGDVVLDYGDGGSIEAYHSRRISSTCPANPLGVLPAATSSRRRLGDLRSQMGPVPASQLRARGSGWNGPRGAPWRSLFSRQAERGNEAFVGDFGRRVCAAQRPGGPRTFLPEYGPRQFRGLRSILHRPLTAADTTRSSCAKIARFSGPPATAADSASRRVVTRGGRRATASTFISALADESGAPRDICAGLAPDA